MSADVPQRAFEEDLGDPVRSLLRPACSAEPQKRELRPQGISSLGTAPDKLIERTT